MNAHTLELASLACAAVGSVAGLVGFARARGNVRALTIAATPTTGDAPESPPNLLRRLVAPLAERMRPTSQHDLEQLVTRLQRAGRRGRFESDRFLEEKVLCAFVGIAGGLALGIAAGGGGGFLLMMLVMLVGLLGADRLLDARGARRRDACAAGMPGAVDLLVTCLDAGLSVEHAISRVARDLEHATPILAEELRITASEFEAGVSLPDALRRLARRVGLDDLSALCGVIAQAHSLGAPIASTLRDYAESSRRQRMSQLEERAGKLSTQMTLPLATCLLPAALLVILGPAAIQLMNALK